MWTCCGLLQLHKSGERGEIQFTKIKKYFHTLLFPASVDKSVHKIVLPAKYRTFLHLKHVIA